MPSIEIYYDTVPDQEITNYLAIYRTDIEDVVGSLTAFVTPDDERSLYIHRLDVDPLHRRVGVATELGRSIIATLSRNDAPKITSVTTAIENPDVITLIEQIIPGKVNYELGTILGPDMAKSRLETRINQAQLLTESGMVIPDDLQLFVTARVSIADIAGEIETWPTANIVELPVSQM